MAGKRPRTLLRFEPLATFAIAPGKLRWPWISLSPDRRHVAYPTGPHTIGLRSVDRLDEEAILTLPEAFHMPTQSMAATGSTARQPGLHAIAVNDDGTAIVAFAWHGAAPVACVAGIGREPTTIDLTAALDGMGPMSTAFARTGDALWLTTESETGAAILRLRASDLAVIGHVGFKPPPLPAQHEVFTHPFRDEALLLMACGQDGTFARIARFDGEVTAIPCAAEDGIEPAGLADWDHTGHHVFLAGDTGLERRTFPDLELQATSSRPTGFFTTIPACGSATRRSWRRATRRRGTKSGRSRTTRRSWCCWTTHRHRRGCGRAGSEKTCW
jgi:hypothetical protein